MSDAIDHPDRPAAMGQSSASGHTSESRERLADFKVPRVGLPREDSGKIMKRWLREPHWVEAGRRILTPEGHCDVPPKRGGNLRQIQSFRRMARYDRTKPYTPELGSRT